MSVHKELPVAATDVETTGTDPARHVAWEVAVVRRGLDGTVTRRLWQIRPTSEQMRAADDEALDISRFRDRFAVPDGWDAADMTPTPTGGQPAPLDRAGVAQQVWNALDGTVMIGSNAHFDASFLRSTLAVLDRDGTPWYYRPTCAVTLAAGRLRALGMAWRMPYPTTTIAETLGVPRPGPDEQHTALGDADWALALYDAATAPVHMPALKFCLLPGCMREFDMAARMEGRAPERPSWSGDGWVHMRPTILTGYACPTHADLIRGHRITWQQPEDGTRALACSCGWTSPTARWRGVSEAAWQEHLLEKNGAAA